MSSELPFLVEERLTGAEKTSELSDYGSDPPPSSGRPTSGSGAKTALLWIFVLGCAGGTGFSVFKLNQLMPVVRQAKELASQNELLAGDLQKANTDIVALQKQLDEQTTSQKAAEQEMESRVSSLNSEIGELQDGQKRVIAQHKEREAELDGQIGTLKGELAVRQKEATELEKKLADLREQNKGLAGEKESVKRLAEDYATTLASTRRRVDVLLTQITSLEAEAKKTRALLAKTQNALAETKTSLVKTEEVLGDTKTALAQTQVELTETKQQRDQLKEVAKELDGGTVEERRLTAVGENWAEKRIGGVGKVIDAPGNLAVGVLELFSGKRGKKVKMVVKEDE